MKFAAINARLPGGLLPPVLSPRHNQILMFGVVLVAAIGNTGMHSILPAIGRSLGLADTWVAIAFSLSALLWMLSAPFWAKRTESRGARHMIIVGIGGYVVSLLVCGVALTAGIRGWLPAVFAFAIFIVGRGIYGCFGSAAPPAAQALVVASTPRAGRTRALTLLSSAFGLGTIVGPALAPFFLLPFVGLAGPAFVFAAMGGAMILLIRARLKDTARPRARARAAVEPDHIDTDMIADEGLPESGISYRDLRIRPWLIFGIVSTHAQAIINMTMAFLVIDRLKVTPIEAQPLIGLVLTAGAAASLLAQWGVIPRLDLQPRAMVLWGGVLAAIGALGIAFADDLHMMAMTFAMSSLGFGFLRPGYTAGASLAVEENEQAVVAGYIASLNGGALFAGPTIGILFYEAMRPLPYLVSAVLMAALVLYGLRRLRTE